MMGGVRQRVIESMAYVGQEKTWKAWRLKGMGLKKMNILEKSHHDNVKDQTLFLDTVDFSLVVVLTQVSKAEI